MPVRINMDVSALDQLTKELGEFPIHTKNVIQDSMLEGAKVARRKIPYWVTAHYSIPEASVKQAMKVKTLRWDEASIQLSGYPLTATRFSHFPHSIGTRLPVLLGVKGLGVLKPVSPQTGSDGRTKKPFLFAPKNLSGSSPVPYLMGMRTGIWSRKSNGAAKEKIHVLRTVSVPQMVQNPRVLDPLMEEINQAAENKMVKEMDELLTLMERKVEK